VVSHPDAQPSTGETTPVYRARLTDLLDGSAQPQRDIEVSDLVMDSRQAGPGAVFLACRGRSTHGVVHADEAAARGVFGAPTFIIDGEDLYWGQDRLGLVEAALRS